MTIPADNGFFFQKAQVLMMDIDLLVRLLADFFGGRGGLLNIPENPMAHGYPWIKHQVHQGLTGDVQ